MRRLSTSELKLSFWIFGGGGGAGAGAGMEVGIEKGFEVAGGGTDAGADGAVLCMGSEVYSDRNDAASIGGGVKGGATNGCSGASELSNPP